MAIQYNKIYDAIKSIYKIEPGCIISFVSKSDDNRYKQYRELNIQLLEKSDIGIRPVKSLKNIKEGENFIIIKDFVYCEDWRENIQLDFPELITSEDQRNIWDAFRKKSVFGNTLTPVTPYIQILYDEKLYFISMVDFFLDLLAKRIKNIV